MIYNIPFSYDFIPTLIQYVVSEVRDKKIYNPIIILRNKAELNLAYGLLGGDENHSINLYTYDDLCNGKINDLLLQSIYCTKGTRLITHTELLLLIDDAVESYKSGRDMASQCDDALSRYFDIDYEKPSIDKQDMHSVILQTFYEYEQHNITKSDLDPYNHNEMFFAYIIEYIDAKLIEMSCTTEIRLWREIMELLHSNQPKCKTNPIYIVAPSINFYHLYELVVWLYQNANCGILVYGLNKSAKIWHNPTTSSCQYGHITLLKLLNIKYDSALVIDLAPFRLRDEFIDIFVNFVERGDIDINHRTNTNHLSIAYTNSVFEQIDHITKFVLKTKSPIAHIISDCEFLTTNIYHKIAADLPNTEFQLNTLPRRYYKQAEVFDILQLTIAYATAKKPELSQILLNLLQSPHRTEQKHNIELVITKFITSFLFLYNLEHPEKILELFACDMDASDTEGYSYLRFIISSLTKWRDLAHGCHEISQFWQFHATISGTINLDLTGYDRDPIPKNNDDIILFKMFHHELQKVAQSLSKKFSLRQYILILRSALEMQPKSNAQTFNTPIAKTTITLTNSYGIDDIHQSDDSTITILATTQDSIWPGLPKSGSLIGSYTRNKLNYNKPGEYHISMRFAKFLSIIAKEGAVLCHSDSADRPVSRWIAMLIAFALLHQIKLYNVEEKYQLHEYDSESDRNCTGSIRQIPDVPKKVISALPPLNARPDYISATSLQQLMMNPYLYYCRYILNLKQLTNAYENSTNDIYKREFGIVVHNTVEHMIFTDNQEDYAQNFMIHAKREVDILFFKRSVLSDIVAQREYVFWMWEQKLANIALWLHNNEMELRKKFIVSETLHEQKYRIISDGDALQLKQPQNRPILTLVPEREMLGDFRAEDHIVGVHDDSIMNKTMQPSVEVEFEKRSNELQPLKFEVVCDRIDFVQNESGEEYIIITDYKTGVLPSSKHILDWNYPQLLFEGLIVEQALARGKKAKIMLRYLGLYGSNSMAGIEKWISFDYEKNYAILRDIVVKYYHDQEPYYSSGNHYDNEYKYVLREI